MYFPGDVVQEGRIFETSVYNYKYIVQDYSYSWICFMHYSHYLRTAERLHNSVSPWLCHSAKETRLTTWMWGLKPWLESTRKAPFRGGKACQSLGVSDFNFYNFPDLTCSLLAGFNLTNTGAFWILWACDSPLPLQQQHRAFPKMRGIVLYLLCPGLLSASL